MPPLLPVVMPNAAGSAAARPPGTVAGPNVVPRHVPAQKIMTSIKKILSLRLEIRVVGGPSLLRLEFKKGLNIVSQELDGQKADSKSS